MRNGWGYFSSRELHVAIEKDREKSEEIRNLD